MKMKNFFRLSLWVMVTAVITLAGCATIPDDDLNQSTTTDEQLADNVLQRLNQDAMTSRSAFGVEARDGVVTLYGSLPNDILRARAIAIARSTPGVKDVINKITRW